MATLIQNAHSIDHAVPTARPHGLIQSIATYFASKLERANVMRELQACEPRDLRDLGISTTDFDAIARGVYKR